MTSIVARARKTLNAGSRYLFTVAVIVLSLIISTNAATSVTDGSTPLALQPGVPAGAYLLSGFDSVNPYNGRLNFRLPLLQVGGRGGVHYTMALLMERHWRVLITGSHLNPTKIPTPTGWADLDPGYGPGVLVGRLTGINDTQSCAPSLPSLTRLTFIESDGTEYELRDKTYGGQPKENFYEVGPGGDCIIEDGLIVNRGRVFVSGDGTAVTFISDSDIHDYEGGSSSVGQSTIRPSGYLFLRDGTCYRIQDGLVQWIRDRNGNMTNFHYDSSNRVDTVTDSLNRQITITYAGDPCLSPPDPGNSYDEISYKGFEQAVRTVRVNYDCLANALRSDFPTPVKTYHQLFPNLNGSSSSSFNPRVVSSVTLPNGQSYTFKYNYYSELARVVLPTGGAFQYNFDAGVVGGESSGTFFSSVYRRVVKKEIFKDASDPNSREGYMTFSRPENISGANDGFVEVDHYSPLDLLLAVEKHFYTGKPTASFSQQPTDYPPWQDGKESKTQSLNVTAGTAGSPLHEVANEWEQGVPQHVNWWAGSADLAPPNNPRLKSATTKLMDTTPTLISKTESGYDQYNNVTDTCNYDFGSNAVGPLLRHTHTQYMVTHPVTQIDYTAFNINSPSTSIHQRSLPLSEIVNSSCTDNQTFVSKTDYEYDNYTADGPQNHGALTNRSDICSHDANLGTTYLTRGNVTAVMHWLNTDGSTITSYQLYDIAGNVVKSKDPRGNLTTIDFTDKFGSPDGSMTDVFTPPELGMNLKTYAFATTVTNAKNQTSSAQYSYYAGKPVDAQDHNSIVSSGHYDDPFERPKRIVKAARDSSDNSVPPSRSQTIFNYLDATNIVSTASDLNTYQDGLLQSTLIYDKLGRTKETQHTVPQGIIHTTQTYDEMGRASQASNPFFTTSDPTYGHSVTTYDALSRVIKVQTFDNANTSTGFVQTNYDNNKVTVTDQALKKRRSVTDGLGRLVRVDEPDANGNLDVSGAPAQPTNYGYDLLGNLTLVQQTAGATTQTRRFAYDSLSRLIFAANPEQETSTDPLFTYSSQQWAVRYEYDVASNLSKKTDTRVVPNSNPPVFVSTSYAYDVLNRVLSRTYVDGTPNVSYVYDTATKGVGMLASVAATGVSTTNYLSYDALGRLKTYNQQTAGQTYSMSSTYNLAGMILDEVYPSGKTIHTDYDTAGRMIDVKQGTTYYAGDAANPVQYSAHGAVTAMKLGNGLWEHADFNSRLQPKLIGLGTAIADSSKLKLEYDYGTTTNNGNLASQKITAPTSTGTLLLTQAYNYDSLNRLSSAQETVNQETTPRWTQSYGYDRWANRTTLSNAGSEAPSLPTQSTPAVTAATNRLAAVSYDKLGNQLADTGGRPLTYDAENHQKSFTDTATGIVYSYSYDADGRRVKRDYNDGAHRTTVFVYNATAELIAEYSSNAVPPPGGGGTSYLTTDHLGSTRIVTKADGSVKARYDYLPYGEEIPSTIGGRGSVAGYALPDTTRQKFTRKERDAESGLDYFLARYYSSSQGRFTSPDDLPGGPKDLINFADTGSANPTFYSDLHEPQSLNKYQYCYNNPIKYSDADGHDPSDGDGEGISGGLSYIKGLASGVTDSFAGTVQLITHPIDTVKETAKSLYEIGKTNLEVIKHPRQAASALADAVDTLGWNKTAEIVGNANGQLLGMAIQGKIAKTVAVEVEARASILPRVESAAKLGGNQPSGSVINASRSGVGRAGKIWTGSGARPFAGRAGSAPSPGTFNPATGRSYRPPTAKPYGGTVANFESKVPKSNVHVNIKWSLW